MRLLLIIFILPIVVTGQSLKKSLINAASLNFRNHIYVYGFETNKTGLSFKIFKFNYELSKTDSAKCSLDKDQAESYLDITTDTLHGYLNFYLQKSNNKNQAVLIRYNDSLRLITKTLPFESNKINSLTTFENEIYTFKKSTYTIRTSEDSLGRQFYLNKYTILDEKKIFEYKQDWQLPLEKKNINLTHVFFADQELVFLYVNIISGEKKGQWILKINSKNGTIIKGIKLNPKGDSRWFIYNSHFYDFKSKQLIIAGNAYSEEQIDLENGKHTFKNLDKQNNYFFTIIDSTCENIQRLEKTIPFTFANNKAASKEVFSYHVKLKELKQAGNNEYSVYCSVYKSINAQLLFTYETGLHYTVSFNEDGIELYTDKLQLPLSSLPGLITNDPKDFNGKLELKDIKEFDKFLYKLPIGEIENQFGKDDLKNPKWIFTKTDLASGKKSFYDIRIGTKGIEKKSILESSKYNHPEIYKIKSDKILIFDSNKESGGFTLVGKYW